MKPIEKINPYELEKLEAAQVLCLMYIRINELIDAVNKLSVSQEK